MATAAAGRARTRMGGLAFALVLAAYLLYLPFSGHDGFHFDAALYWRLGGTFVSDGQFSLYDYPDPLRGYSFPLALGGLRGLVTALGLSPTTVVRVANAVVIALLGTQLLPRLAQRILPEVRVTFGRILAFNALVFLFWRDYASYPLTDFPALALAAGALLLALRQRWHAALAAGLLAGLAMNARPAYLLAALLLVPLAAARARRPEAGPRWRPAAVAAALVALGIAAALAPQVAINRHTFHDTSPFPVGNESLALLQLSVGLEAQKYETTVDPEAAAPGVYFLDPGAGTTLTEDDRRQAGSYGEYLGIVADDPLGQLVDYLRRTFNGADLQYPSPYVRHIDGDRDAIRSFVLYSLLFAAGLLLLIRRGRSSGGIDWQVAACFLLPALSAVPGAVETRFFLPVNLAVLAIACFTPGARQAFLSLGRGRRTLAALAYPTFVAGCFLLAADTYSRMGHLVEAS